MTLDKLGRVTLNSSCTMPILVSTPEHISIGILEKSIGKCLSVHLKLNFEIIPLDGSQSPEFQNINTTTL